MANMEYLQEGVKKATEKVIKCKGTIVKHLAAAEKKLDVLVKKGITLRSWKDNGFYDLSYEDKSLVQDYEGKLDEADGATKKLKAAEEILANWTAKLNVEIDKAKFLKGACPPIIKEFLERWKKLAFEWHVKRYEAFLKFKEVLKQEELEACISFLEENKTLYAEYLTKGGKVKADYRNWSHMHSYVRPKKPLEAYLKSQKLDYGSIRMRESAFAGQTVLTMCDYCDETKRLAWLDKMLEEEKKAKMLDLIQRVNAVIGSIEDASGLDIDPKGNLNGIVAGKQDKAKVETIGAGGWNIQCFHYRVLVHKLNDQQAKKAK